MYEATLGAVNEVQALCPFSNLLQIRQALEQSEGSVNESVNLLNERRQKKKKAKASGDTMVAPATSVCSARFQNLREALWSGSSDAQEVSGSCFLGFVKHIAAAKQEQEHNALVRAAFQVCTMVFPDVSRRYLKEVLIELPDSHDMMNKLTDQVHRRSLTRRRNADAALLTKMSSPWWIARAGMVSARIVCGVFSQRKLSALQCLEMGGCDGSIPEEGIKKSLPTETYEALQKIQTDVSLELANTQLSNMPVLRLWSYLGR